MKEMIKKSKDYGGYDMLFVSSCYDIACDPEDNIEGWDGVCKYCAARGVTFPPPP